jgi:uncharacterized Zn-finger protein
MALLLCTLCDQAVETVQFDLRKSFTSYTKTSLLTLLQSCVEEELLITNYSICNTCYMLFNELDSVNLRAKTIEGKLKDYVYKHSGDTKTLKNEIIEEEDENNIEVCSKKIYCKNFKNPIKNCQSELHDLDTSFDFDEVNSISEINPSLQDITLLNNGIEPTEKNYLKTENEPIVKKSEIREENTSVLKPYKCHQCLKTWRTSAELKNHLSSHSKERPYVCEICGQAYKRQQALKIHVGMHKGINPFTCIYCNKSFTQKGALVRHIPIHTGELPFQCDLCGKRFVHHTSFNMHRLSHTGQKSYKCDICGLLLMSGSHLKRHVRVHTGEKKFSCNTCGKKFAEKYNLAVHEKLHLGVTKKKSVSK